VQTISRAEKFIYDNNSNKLRIKQFWIVQVSLMLLAWLLALHGPWFHGTLPYWHQFHACIQVAFRIDHLDDHTKKSVEVIQPHRWRQDRLVMLAIAERKGSY